MEEGVFRVVHGSEDSVDLDVIYLYKGKLPSNAEFVKFQKENEEEDVNFGLLNDDGVVIDCMKGVPSEVHNMILCNGRSLDGVPIKREAMKRGCAEKLLDSFQKLVIMVRRCQAYREEAIQCLRSNQISKMITLAQSIDFRKIELDTNEQKTIAFFLTQSIALAKGEELYTKAALKKAFPQAGNLLYRCEKDYASVLQALLTDFWKLRRASNFTRIRALF